MSSQSVMSWDGVRDKKKWYFSLFLKAGRVEMDGRWHGSLFQISEATDENDLDFAITDFWVGTQIKENLGRRRSKWSFRNIPWNKGGKNCKTWKFILWWTGSQCRSERIGKKKTNCPNPTQRPYQAADVGLVTLLGLLDLSATFDKVDHQILLNRLKHNYGITGWVIEWIQSYLTGRTRFIRFNRQWQSLLMSLKVSSSVRSSS